MRKAIIVLLAASFLAGCGYTTRSALSPALKTINIATFKNQTYEYQIESTLTNKIANEFIIDGRLQVVNADEADTQLAGIILEYCREPLVYDSNEEVTQYKIQVFADVTLKDLEDGAIIWEGSRISGEDIYFVTGNLANTEEKARFGAFQDLAGNIVDQVIEGW